ncbi:hypothetical protein SLE2022_234690 [Rubroshorea leprosula]
MGNYCSLEGVLYHKPQFEQLIKEKGCFTKKFQTAYSLDKVSEEGELNHKSYFRCSYGGCFLTPTHPPTLLSMASSTASTTLL